MLKIKLQKLKQSLVLLPALIIILTFMKTQNVISQNKKAVKDKQPVELKKENSPLEQTPVNLNSQRELEIMEQINQIKQTNNNSYEGDKILELQRKLETTNGSSITKTENENIGTIIPASRFETTQTDNINLSIIINYAYNYIGGIAVQVEQRGATAGKIWIAVGLINGDTGALARPDTISMYYSNNNGASYNLYAKIAFSGHNKLDPDNMDMEIIENTTGQKYLHIVFGYTTNGGYGQKLIGYTVVAAPTLGYSGFTLFPPGYNASSIYTKARITSDNARYPSNPYITVVITQDSIAGGNEYFMSKVCRVLSPFTTTPAVTYLSKSIYSVAPGYGDVFTDVANYHNGSDSLLFVLSGYGGGYQDKIYFYKAFSNTTVYPTSNGFVSPSGNNIENARVASNGGSNQKNTMITYSDDYLNSGDFDQWILTTSDASNWSSTALDNTTYNISRGGDVIGRRNADGSFAVNFKNLFGNLENIASYTFTDLALSGSMHSLNTNYANSFFSPKPAFKYVNNDSCLSIWGYFYDLYSTGGCSASNLYVTLGIEGIYDETIGLNPTYEYVYILLAESFPPYNVIDTGLCFLNYNTLDGVATFPSAPNGNYYLIIEHRNALQTWSSAPVAISSTSPSFYDFTSSNSQSYGDNMILNGTKWCLYSGDVDRDGTIDGTDLNLIDNDVFYGAIGYSSTDLNSDAFTDGSDISIVDPNVANGISYNAP